MLNIILVTFITDRKPDKFFMEIPLSTKTTVNPKSGTEIKCPFTDKSLNREKISRMRHAVNVTKGLFIDSLEELNNKSRIKRLGKYTGCLYREHIFYFLGFPGNKEFSTFLF